jgi:hypothetical protein
MHSGVASISQRCRSLYKPSSSAFDCVAITAFVSRISTYEWVMKRAQIALLHLDRTNLQPLRLAILIYPS